MELLSEQLTISDYIGEVSTSNGSTANTGSALDMRDYHRVIAYGIANWTTTAGTTNVSGSLQIQASTSSAFGGTPSTITTGTFSQSATTTTGSSQFSVSCDGEAIQSARVAEDRYARGVLTLTTGAASHTVTGDAIVLRANSRYKPS